MVSCIKLLEKLRLCKNPEEKKNNSPLHENHELKTESLNKVIQKIHLHRKKKTKLDESQLFIVFCTDFDSVIFLFSCIIMNLQIFHTHIHPNIVRMVYI